MQFTVTTTYRTKSGLHRSQAATIDAATHQLAIDEHRKQLRRNHRFRLNKVLGASATMAQTTTDLCRNSRRS